MSEWMSEEEERNFDVENFALITGGLMIVGGIVVSVFILPVGLVMIGCGVAAVTFGGGLKLYDWWQERKEKKLNAKMFSSDPVEMIDIEKELRKNKNKKNVESANKKDQPKVVEFKSKANPNFITQEKENLVNKADFEKSSLRQRILKKFK